MYIELKYLLKKAIITESKIQIGKLSIDVENITEIKFQMATPLRQGFITFCTLNGGQDVVDINTSTLDKNSIMFYKKDNIKVSTILEHFSNFVPIIESEELKQRDELTKLNAKAKVEELKKQSINRAQKLKEENEKMSETFKQNSKPVSKTPYAPSKQSKPVDDDAIHCPKCGSTQITAQKRGFSLGKALVGGTLSLGVGAVTGAMGKNKIEVTCLNCGHKWKAGKK